MMRKDRTYSPVVKRSVKIAGHSIERSGPKPGTPRAGTRSSFRSKLWIGQPAGLHGWLEVQPEWRGEQS